MGIGYSGWGVGSTKRLEMSEVLQVGNKTIESGEIPVLLKQYGLWGQFLRGVVIDEAIAEISLSEEESRRAVEEWRLQNKLGSIEDRDAWLTNQGLTIEQMEEMILRPLRLEKFKQAKWHPKADLYFIERKQSFDQVVYSLLRTQDQGLAWELYYRIQQGEMSFAECARQYSKGPESQTGGLLGPVALSQPHPQIGKMLSVSQPGKLWRPQALAEWFIIIRLEKYLPAKLDDAMRRRLVEEMHETWLQEQVQLISKSQTVESPAPSKPL